MRRVAATRSVTTIYRGRPRNPLTRVICRDLPRLCRKHFGASLCDAMPGDSFPWGVRVDRLVLHGYYKGSKFRGCPEWRRRLGVVYVPSGPDWKLRERFTERPFRWAVTIN